MSHARALAPATAKDPEARDKAAQRRRLRRLTLPAFPHGAFPQRILVHSEDFIVFHQVAGELVHRINIAAQKQRRRQH